ncbi:MAG: ATP-grasp domain-containing protein [Dehalococcoidales bacterium]|nr:ATP-grasp domain-containing protein [Dehalococcoidales bacterium]
MKRRKVLILGASEEMIPLMLLARQEGCKVLATDRNPDAPGLAHADTPFHLDASDVTKVIAVAKMHKVNGILTRTELLLPVLARACALLGFSGPSEEVAALSVDKYLFRQKMSEGGLMTPAFHSPRHVSEVRQAVTHTGLPAMVKPVDFSGSTGVVRVDTPEQSEAAWNRARQLSPSGKVIIEQMLEGKEVSVETWTAGGTTHIAAITGKQVSDNGHFVELRHTIPADITEEEKLSIQKEVHRMACIMKLNHCITHTEVLLTSRGPVIIETGARPGGDLIGLQLVEMATGINMNRIMLYLALGMKIVPQLVRSGAAAIQYVSSENRAFIESRHETLLKDANFAGYRKIREDDPGQLHASTDRLAYYLFRANDLPSLNNSLTSFDES